LEDVIAILRSHFRETDATTVFQELTNATQGRDQSETDFCFKLMGLRQQVLRLSAEQGGQYTPELAQQRFEMSLLSGLRNEPIRQQMRAVMREAKGEAIEDSVLLAELGELVMREAEHLNKTMRGPRTGGLNMMDVSTDDRTSTTKGKANDQGSSPLVELTKLATQSIAEISKLTAQVNELGGLKTEVLQLKEGFEQAAQQRQQVPGQQPPGPPAAAIWDFWRQRPQRPFGCNNCVANNLPNCRHCFRCGELGHKTSDNVCPRNPPPLN
jgi:hypothetical protein